jgi:hypothetical protein
MAVATAGRPYGGKGILLLERFKKLERYRKSGRYLGPAIVCSSLFLAGLILFTISGELLFFLTEAPEFFVILGIFVAMEGMVWAYGAHESAYEDAVKLFDEPAKELLASTLKKTHTESDYAPWCLFFIALFEVYLLAMKSRLLPTDEAFYHGAFSSSIPQLYLVALMALTGYIGGLGICSAVRHIRFMNSIARLKLQTDKVHESRVNNDTRRLKELRGLVSLSFIGSVFWFLVVMLVGLAGVALRNVDSSWILTLLVFGLLLGMVFFFMPQVLLRSKVVEAKKSMREGVLAEFERQKGFRPPEGLSSYERSALHSQLEQIEKLEELPVDYTTILEEVIVGLVSFLIVYAAQSIPHL